MANIDIYNLDASELFNDSESFLADLDEQELNDVIGGWSYYPYNPYNNQYTNNNVNIQTEVGNSNYNAVTIVGNR